jgi:diadenosine tetraphosphate (Ap4A) HIT family hydrolase
MAFLDIYPTHYGQTLVIPKNHYPSRFSDAKADTLQELVSVSQNVAKILEKRLNAERCILVIEGLELDHLHLKLYPALLPEPTKFLLSKSGEKATDKELGETLKRIVG